MHLPTCLWMFVCTAVLAAAGGVVGRAQPSASPDDLFSREPVVDDRPAAPAEVSPSGTRARTARVSQERFADDLLRLNLFPGVSLDARRGATPQPGDTATWSGRVEGDALSSVTFVRHGDIVQGAIRTATAAYSVEPIGDGPVHVIRQVNWRGAPPELPPLVPPASAAVDARLALEGPSADDGPTVDVLVVYTAEARLQAGGSDAAVHARIALGMAETNAAYANSGVLHRVRLVGAELVGYRESGDLSEDLQRLTSGVDGLMDIVHARRDAAGADLVTLIVGSTAGGACGVAWVMQSVSVGFAPYAFSVTAYPCISPNYTFAHELAHNLGTAHAPEDPNAPPVFPYAYGYKDPEQRFRTVMAYDCPGGCPRVLHFSNPATTYDGEPTGTPAVQDNALALNQTAPTAASFRPARDDSTRLTAPSNFAVETAGTTATLAWVRPAIGEPASYAVEVGSDEGLADIASFPVNGAATALLQPHVPPGNYHLRVRAYDAYGPGPPSTSVQVVMTGDGRCLAPAAAPHLLPPVVSEGAVQLAWEPPAGGGLVDRYLVGAGTQSQTTDVVVFDTASAATAFTTPAAPGVYFVRVAGVNPCGIGEPSNEVGVVVGPPVPGPPVALIAGVAVDRRVTLWWQPSGVGGDATSHVVEAGSEPGLSDIAVLASAGPLPTFSIAAAPGRYYVRVRAVNEFGTSVASEMLVLVQ